MAFTHMDENGNAVMVDVSEKAVTQRTAVARGAVSMSPGCFAMVRDGVLVRFDEKHYMHWEMRQKALDMAYLLYEEKGMIQTGEFRDRLGISRKCAIILLERFDRERITVMENGGRVLKRNLQQADRSQ